jgi:hypothetical protein
MAFALPLIPPAVEAITAGLIALGVIGTGVVVADQVDRARRRSQTATRDATTEACVSCRRNNPCAQYAAGSHGGAHGFMKEPPGDGLDSHHMPAASASPLPRDMGPAIRMTEADHRMTASNGQRGPSARVYIEAQRRLISQGNFRAAFAMDVADIRANHGSKYDVGIAQATAYMECLKRNGLIQ